MPFDASEDHYGCPAPVNPLNGEVKSFFMLITKISPEKDCLTFASVRLRNATGGQSCGSSLYTKQKSQMNLLRRTNLSTPPRLEAVCPSFWRKNSEPVKVPWCHTVERASDKFILQNFDDALGSLDCIGFSGLFSLGCLQCDSVTIFPTLGSG